MSHTNANRPTSTTMNASTNGTVNANTNTQANAPSRAQGHGATAVITHRVREGQQDAYELWLDEIGPKCRAAPGHLDWHIIRPIAGLTHTNTVVLRFDTITNLERWMASADRRRLIEQVSPLLATEDEFFINSGLDFWFVPEGAHAKVPVRWKQFVITWSAIYPLVLGVSLVVSTLLLQVGLSLNGYLFTLIVTGLVVALMIYLVMPYYTHMVRSWLFK